MAQLLQIGESFHMKQGGMVDSIYAPTVSTAESDDIMGALDASELMKCKGITRVFEYDDTLTIPLPTPPATIYKKKFIQVKLENANKQLIVFKGEFPYDAAIMSDVETWVQTFVGVNLSFGNVETATWEVL